MKKRILSIFIVLTLCIVTACSSNNTLQDTEQKISTKPTEKMNPTDTLTPTEIPVPTETTVPTEIPESTEIPAPTEMPDLTETPVPTEIPIHTDDPVPTEISVLTHIPTTIETPIDTEEPVPTIIIIPTDLPDPTGDEIITPTPVISTEPTGEPSHTGSYAKETLIWSDDWKYADYSKIHTDSPVLYYSSSENRKNIVVAVNAGHGTVGGEKVKTLCHPDGTQKVTGGSTAKGSTYATAVSYGTTFFDGTREATANLSLAIILKDLLLEEGYDVLMIRESTDVQLDNIARTVFSNQYADCHIALHYDSSEYDKGFFYIGVPNVTSYRAMEPVASHWEQHNALGEALLEGIRTAGVKIFSDGNIPMDLTQTSYSTIPSIDVEVGDRASDYSEKNQRKVAKGLLEGINIFFNAG